MSPYPPTIQPFCWSEKLSPRSQVSTSCPSLARFHAVSPGWCRMTSPAAPTAQPEPSGSSITRKSGSTSGYSTSIWSKAQRWPPSLVRAMRPSMPEARPRWVSGVERVQREGIERLLGSVLVLGERVRLLLLPALPAIGRVQDEAVLSRDEAVLVVGEAHRVERHLGSARPPLPAAAAIGRLED